MSLESFVDTDVTALFGSDPLSLLSASGRFSRINSSTEVRTIVTEYLSNYFSQRTQPVTFHGVFETIVNGDSLNLFLNLKPQEDLHIALQSLQMAALFEVFEIINIKYNHRLSNEILLVYALTNNGCDSFEKLGRVYAHAYHYVHCVDQPNNRFCGADELSRFYDAMDLLSKNNKFEAYIRRFQRAVSSFVPIPCPDFNTPY